MSEDKKKTESPQKDPWAVGVYNKYVNPNTGVPKQQTPPPPPRGMEAGRVGVQAPTQPKVTAPSKNDSSNTISPHSGMESARVGGAPPQATTPQKEAVPQSRGMEASRVGGTVATPPNAPKTTSDNSNPSEVTKQNNALAKFDRGYQLPAKNYIVQQVRDKHELHTSREKVKTDYKRDKDSRYKPKPGVDYMPDEEFSAFTAYLRDNNIDTGPIFSAEDAMYHPELAKFRRENIEKLHADPDFAEFQKYYQSHGYNDDYFRGIPYKSSPVYLGFIGSKTQREMMNEYRAKQAKNGKGVSDARMAGSNDATSNYDRGAGKEEKGNPSGVDNPSGVTAEVPSTHFEDMYRKTTEAPMSSEETTKMRKRHNRQRTLAAIIDGISALANVYFASRGAGANGSTNFSGTLGNKWREHWDKVRTDRDAYNKGLLQARQMDYNAKLRRLERAEDKAEREAREANAEKWRQKEYDYKQTKANQQQSNWQTTHDDNQAQRKIQNENTAKKLGISQQNANTSALKAKGDIVAYDENGNPHYFDDDVSADNFARDHGTLGERMVEVETTYTDEYGYTKTRKEKKPVTYRKGPNEIKKTGAGLGWGKEQTDDNKETDTDW